MAEFTTTAVVYRVTHLYSRDDGAIVAVGRFVDGAGDMVDCTRVLGLVEGTIPEGLTERAVIARDVELLADLVVWYDDVTGQALRSYCCGVRDE